MAGGSGKRLRPLTISISKQLMPIYDKPMLYYPLTTLMLAGIREILVITNNQHYEAFKELLKDGRQWGLSISYEIQEYPRGIAEAFIIGESFLNNSPSALILGDNLFHSSDIVQMLKNADEHKEGATIFTYRVKDLENYAVLKTDSQGKLISIVEKPKSFISPNAVTGLYFYDKEVVDFVKYISPSDRNELEITSINEIYLKKNKLRVEKFNRGSAWLDTGNFDSLHQASSYIRTLERRTGLKIGCPEEVAWRQGWINSEELCKLAEFSKVSGYGEYLINLVDEVKN